MRSYVAHALVGLLGLAVAACGAAPEGAAAGESARTVGESLSVASPMKLDVGSLESVGGTWTTVTLPASYTSMVVVATPSYSVSSPPLVTRVRNATGSSFEVRVERFDTSTAPFTPVPVQYVVAEAGRHDAASGLKMEAVRLSSTVTDRKGSWNGQVRSYQQSYTAPIVLGQVMSANDPRPSAFWSRGNTAKAAPTTTVLRVGKHVGEDTVTTRAAETLGYIVLEAGQGTLGGVAWQAGITPVSVGDVVNDPAAPVALSKPGATTVGVLSQAGMNNGDGSFALLSGSAATTGPSLLLNVDEDNFGDTERNHGLERVAYFAVNQCPSAASEGQACGADGACRADGTCCPDSDGDGSCNDVDECPSYDDDVDADNDGIADGCDQCAGFDDAVDADNDGVPNGCDVCAGYDDHQDTDGDGIPNGCDQNPLQCVPGFTGPGVINGNVTIDQTNTAADVAPLNGVWCVTGYVMIINTTLPNLQGLSSLKAIGGNLSMGGGNNPWGNNQLTSLQGLNALERVGGTLSITNSPKLMDVSALGALKQVTSIDLRKLPLVTDFSMLSRFNSLTGDLTLGTLPGLSNLTTLQNLQSVGSLWLDTVPVASLAPLQSLTSVGNLSVRNTNITSLAGLENLTTVGGLYVLDNSLLASLSGAQNITSFGAIVIGRSPLLTTLAPLRPQGSIPGLLTIAQNDSMSDISALAGVTSAGQISLNYMPALTSLAGLESVTSITGTLSIEYMQALSRIDVFSNLQRVGRLLITQNEQLTAFGPTQLTRVDGDLELSGQVLGDISGFSSLASVGGTFRLYAPALTELTALSSLTTVGGGLGIEGSSITSLHGLENLTSFEGSFSVGATSIRDLTGLPEWTHLSNLSIQFNPLLESLAGLEALEVVDQHVTITDSPLLSSLGALENLESLFISLELKNLPALATFDGLQNMTNLQGLYLERTGLTSFQNFPAVEDMYSVEIRFNDALTSLSGLENLEVVQQGFRISASPITSLHGLEGLRHVGSGLSVDSCSELTTLAGLENLTYVGPWLSFAYNMSLPACEITALEQRLGTTCSWCAENNGEGTCGL